MTNSPVLTYYNIAPEVTAFSTTRRGGCSRGAYGGMNVNGWCGDEPEAVEANREALCGIIGTERDRLVMPHQTHGTTVRMIAEEFVTLSETTRAMLLEGVDAVMTNVRGVCVGVSTADCIPVLLYDPENRACCAVHAGWRGTAGRIVEKAIDAMRQSFGTDAGLLRAVIGPGISMENFEVGDEVYDEFRTAGFEMEAISRRYDKWHIDLWACNRLQMEGVGVSPHNIMTSGVCTYSHADEYFSARRLGTASGRIFNGIIINDNR